MLSWSRNVINKIVILVLFFICISGEAISQIDPAGKFGNGGTDDERALLSSCMKTDKAGAQQEPVQGGIVPKIINPTAFKLGESLQYEVSFSKFIFSGTIGRLNLQITKPERDSKDNFVELRANIVSRGFFTWLFGVKVNALYLSRVYMKDLGLDSSTRLIEDGNKRREQKVLIDREVGKLTYIDKDLADPNSEARVRTTDSPRWIQDILSSIYFVRTQKLAEGENLSVPIGDDGRVYTIEVIAGKAEEIKIKGEKYHARVLDARIFDGRFIKRSGQMLVWVTDDGTHVPVKAKVKTSGATINIELESSKSGK